MTPSRTAIPWIAVATLVALAAPVAQAEDEWAEEGRNESGLYLGVTESDGDEAKAKAKYIKLRVEALTDLLKIKK